MKKFPICILIFILLIPVGFSQDRSEEISKGVPPESGLFPLLSDRNMLLLSMSAEDYPVTPGDIYKLTYLSAANPVSQEVIVESDFTVNLNIFGKIKGENIIFAQLKDLVEDRVTQAYPDSTPSFTILSNGRFQVYIKGEVNGAAYITAWGLTRLSQVIGGRLTAYSSIRDIEIVSRNGMGKKYDLFRAKRFGEKKQDPYLKPVATIVVSKREREVQLSGDIKRPGKYQLLPYEGLRQLIHYYGDGFTELADKERVKLDRFITGDSKVAETIYLDLSKGYYQGIPLKDLDRITVPANTNRLPVVYFEGALQSDAQFGTQTSNKIPLRFKEGETLYSVLLSIKNMISPVADLPNAFLTRKGESQPIPIDLEKLLYEYDPSVDLVIRPYDRIVIPFGKFEIFITGEVETSEWLAVESLTRLSDVVNKYLTNYSSIRDIEILSSHGESRKYDLFRAKRFGEKEQDPYLKPGDTIVVSKREREVEIRGEVKRAGKYQLLASDSLKELIEYYGDSFTEIANVSRVVLQRLVTGSDKIAESFSLDLSQGYKQELGLKDLDVIFVPQKTERLPIVYLEGAISSGIELKKGEEEGGVLVDIYSKTIVSFKDGDTIYNILWPRRNLIYPAADLPNSFISRNGKEQIIPINLEKLLYDYDSSLDVELKPYDHIIIPFRQFFVNVTGGVYNPRRYPYVPEKTYLYYVNLAGGIDPERGSKNVIVTDLDNERRNKQSFLEPEDRVHIPYSFGYYFVKYFPIITSSVSAILSILIASGLLR